jgi:GNAT superfamily N-acetyltransferase
VSRELDVTTWYLEMRSPAQRVPPRGPAPEHRIEQAKIASPELSRFLYTAVGGDWFWIDRLGWSYAQWMAFLDRPETETWIAYREGTVAGYFELDDQGERGVEIAYFGVLPRFFGCGLGSALLDAAIRRAWELGPPRVWVHTCTLDHPSALPNYLARGFREYDRKVHSQRLPDAPPGPWEGARRPPPGETPCTEAGSVDSSSTARGTTSKGPRPSGAAPSDST